MRRSILLASLVLIVVVLTGCLAPKVNVRIAPNPIKLSAKQLYADDFNVKGLKLHLSTSGFSVNYTIGGAVISVVDDKGDPALEPITVEIGKGTPIVPGIEMTENGPEVSLGELFDYDGSPTEEQFIKYYNENWKDKVYKVSVTITGDNPTSDTADIRFE
ncbi:MAG: hypothetical protein M0R49_07175 [Limnochordia bacterium]|nr:hypothetical protein [Limnochordia bacterium]